MIPPGDDPPSPPQPKGAWLKDRRKSWSRLIRRVYEVDPFLCRCGELTRIIGFITQAPVIRKILDHVGRRFDLGLTDRSKTTGSRTSPIYSSRLDARCVRGFRVDSSPFVSILTAKGRRKRRCAGARDSWCLADRPGTRKRTANRGEVPSGLESGKRNFLSGLPRYPLGARLGVRIPNRTMGKILARHTGRNWAPLGGNHLLALTSFISPMPHDSSRPANPGTLSRMPGSDFLAPQL